MNDDIIGSEPLPKETLWNDRCSYSIKRSWALGAIGDLIELLWAIDNMQQLLIDITYRQGCALDDTHREK